MWILTSDFRFQRSPKHKLELWWRRLLLLLLLSGSNGGGFYNVPLQREPPAASLRSRLNGNTCEPRITDLKKPNKYSIPHRTGRSPACRRSRFRLGESWGDNPRCGCTAWSASAAPARTRPGRWERAAAPPRPLPEAPTPAPPRESLRLRPRLHLDRVRGTRRSRTERTTPPSWLSSRGGGLGGLSLSSPTLLNHFLPPSVSRLFSVNLLRYYIFPFFPPLKWWNQLWNQIWTETTWSHKTRMFFSSN